MVFLFVFLLYFLECLTSFLDPHELQKQTRAEDRHNLQEIAHRSRFFLVFLCFLKGKNQEINWDEFFLLHSNKHGLLEILDNLSIDELKEKKSIMRILLDKCLRCIEENRNIQVYNACQVKNN